MYASSNAQPVSVGWETTSLFLDFVTDTQSRTRLTFPVWTEEWWTVVTPLWGLHRPEGLSPLLSLAHTDPGQRHEGDWSEQLDDTKQSDLSGMKTL